MKKTLIGLAALALCAPLFVATGEAQAASPCTVSGPMSDSYTSSWSSVWRCYKSPSGLGDAFGGTLTFRPVRSPEVWDCTGSVDPKVDLGYSFAMYNSFVTENNEELGAISRFSCDSGLVYAYPRYYVRHDSDGIKRFARPQQNCAGDAATAYFSDGVESAHPDTGVHSVVIRRERGIETNTADPRWRILWFDRLGSCVLRVTNIDGFGHRSAEQFLNNDHSAIPGSSRHRVRADRMQVQVEDGTWFYWLPQQTGTNGGGYASTYMISGSDWCLRTGDLGPTCP